MRKEKIISLIFILTDSKRIIYKKKININNYVYLQKQIRVSHHIQRRKKENKANQLKNKSATTCHLPLIPPFESIHPFQNCTRLRSRILIHSNRLIIAIRPISCSIFRSTLEELSRRSTFLKSALVFHPSAFYCPPRKMHRM